MTFHAPNALSSWPAFSVDQFRRVVFEGEAVTMANPPGTRTGSSSARTARDDHARQARGRLVGGNLTVLTALVDPLRAVLRRGDPFLEDVREDISRVDRTPTQAARSSAGLDVRTMPPLLGYNKTRRRRERHGR